MDNILLELAQQIRELAATPEHAARRRLWADFHALRPPRALVSYGMYTHVWERDIAGPELFHHRSGLARAIEVQLRARLWKAANVADDEPVLPTLWLGMPHPTGETRLWGVPISVLKTEGRGAYKPVPPITCPDDLGKLHFPPYEADSAAAQSLEDEARKLIGDILPIKFHTDELHFGPFEWAVKLRGMDQLLYDVCDSPDFVHDLMRFITEGMANYHLAREAAGAVDAESSWGFHMYYDALPPGAGAKLKDSWAYCHAQSSASLSPRMYAEFIQPYNERIAGLFGRVYYHGCEDLSAKVGIIRSLPNLRLFHVGPWTPVEPIVRELGTDFSLEVHSHPTNVLFAWTPEQIKDDLIRLHTGSGSSPHVLKLCDVETVDDRGERLKLWAELGREIVETR